MGVVRVILICAAAVAVSLAGQDASAYKTSSVDFNGHRTTAGPDVVSEQSKTGSQTTELTQSINGRMVPLERTDERVVREDASGKVIERMIHRFDLTGNPLAPQKVVIEERKEPNGSSTIQTTKYSGDVNGRMQVMERAVTQKQVSGSTETADTVVERPNINGGLDTVEKQTTVVVKQGKGYEEAASIYRRDPTGNFYQAVRRVTDHSESGNQATDNTAEYEVGAMGQLELHGQTVRKTEKRSNGAEEVQVDMFSKNVPGVVNDTSALRLKEHQIIERRPASGGAVVETLSVQRPTVSDPSRLGPPMQISETVCRGKCDARP